jgi:hypothetical protein
MDVGIVDGDDGNDCNVGDVGKKRGPGFTKTEDLLVCKAWMSASQDSQAAAYQKITVFKNKVWTCYKSLLEKQEKMDVICIKGAITERIVPIYD